MSTITLQQNVNGYGGTSDTYLRESRPNNAYGNAEKIYVDGQDKSNGEIQGLISFSDIFGTGPGQIPLGSTITSATLTLSVTGSSGDPVSLYRMAQDWTGVAGQSWNAFGNGIQTDGVEASAAPEISLSGISSGTQTLDVTQSLQSWSGGTGNYGWLLQSGGSDGFSFSSSESGSAPILSVTYDLPTNPLPGISIVESDGSTIVTEGAAGDIIWVSLQSAPTSDVTITISTTGPDDIALPAAPLVFTSANWATPQTVAIAAIDDALIEGVEQFSVDLTASSFDPEFNGLASNVVVTVNSNDVSQTAISPALVAVHDTTLYKAGDPSGYGAGDPSGIAYIPGLDLLFIADSEHDESPYNSPINLFATRLDGTFVESFSMRSFTREPTGLGYNPFNGLLYITDDDADQIFFVDPNDPTTKVGQIDLRQYGIKDAEDPVIDPLTGNIFMLDGAARSFIELTATGAFVNSTVLPSLIKDAEGLAYDAQSDVFYIASGANRGTIFQTDRSGSILDSFDLLNDYRNPITGGKPKIKGLEIAPSSDPNDGNKTSLYAVDYGVDQRADGRMFEIDLHHNWLGA